MKSIMKGWLSKFILSACILLLLPLQGRAQESGSQWNLVLDSHCDGVVLSGVEYNLYRVADVNSAYPWFSLTGDFASAPVSLLYESEAEWDFMATTLTGYVDLENISPIRSGSSDTEGKLSFQGLQEGVYLVVMNQHEQDGKLFYASSFCVALTNFKRDPKLEDHTVVAEPKIASRSTDGTPLTRKVLKVWKDTGYTNKRPTEITVYLLRDHVVYDQVVLNEKNNWSYQWTELDRTREWSVQEGKCPGYTVKTQQEGNTFVVTNTYQKTPDKPDNPVKPDNPTNPSRTPSKLPQTGQMWWPVAALGLSGLAMVMASAVLRRAGRDE